MKDTDLAEHLAWEKRADIPPRVRQQVLDRDNRQCQVCGTTRENALQLHHIQYRSHGGSHEQWNLVTLCATHHDAVHQGRIFIKLKEIDGVLHAFWRPKKNVTI